MSGDVLTQVYFTNGTNRTGVIKIREDAGISTRVDSVAINTTAYAVALGESSNQNITFAVLDIDGGFFHPLSQAPDAGFIRIGTPTPDICVATGGNNQATEMIDYLMVGRNIDATGEDLTSWRLNLSNLDAGSIDQGFGDSTTTVTGNYRNYIDCDIVNSTRSAIFYVDEGSGDVTQIMHDQLGNSLAGGDADNNAGDSNLGLVGLSDNKEALVWLDTSSSGGDANTIQLEIRDSEQDRIFGVLTIAEDVVGDGTGTDNDDLPRVTITTVTNESDANEEFFVVVWNDRNRSIINASVFNASLTRVYNYVLATDMNTTSLLINVDGGKSFTGLRSCTGTYAFAYKNNTSSGIVQQYWVNGTEFSGNCDPVGEPPADSCNYTGGNWEIDCSDNCNIEADVIIDGSNITMTGTGTFTVQTGVEISNFTRRFTLSSCYYRALGSGGFFQMFRTFFPWGSFMLINFLVVRKLYKEK